MSGNWNFDEKHGKMSGNWKKCWKSWKGLTKNQKIVKFVKIHEKIDKIEWKLKL